ncbi:MAG: phosphocarrier protein [Candidatus Tokpelaia sp. JSC188]|nr:MAG: phosphocarrier protein [Candidatus Tokpelaia sp. JSC188]
MCESFDHENALICEVAILNRRGLHARASAKFVTTVSSYEAHVVVEKDGIIVDGDSIMGLMMLSVPSGSKITIKSSGRQAKNVLDALECLINKRFGEEA